MQIRLILASLALLGLAACGTADASRPDHRIGVLDDPTHPGRTIALAPSCQKWREWPGQDLENDFNPEFGCAQNYNLAKTIVNPNDLVHGHAIGAADANASILGIERYRSDKKKELINPKDIGSTNQ